jgi:hypothetical protein
VPRADPDLPAAAAAAAAAAAGMRELGGGRLASGTRHRRHLVGFFAGCELWNHELLAPLDRRIRDDLHEKLHRADAVLRGHARH